MLYNFKLLRNKRNLFLHHKFLIVLLREFSPPNKWKPMSNGRPWGFDRFLTCGHFARSVDENLLLSGRLCLTDIFRSWAAHPA